MNFKYISLAIFYLQTHRFVIQIKKTVKRQPPLSKTHISENKNSPIENLSIF